MSTTNQQTSETSVLFSLAELARIEEDRVRDEDTRRAQSREQRAREQRETEAQRRAAEEAHVAAQEEARARRQKQEAEEAMRAKAREQAAIEVARIQAEGKARIDADNAARAHELAVLRVQTETRRGRLQTVLATVLGLVICGGAAAGYGANGRISTLEQDNLRLRESQSALAQERDQARTTELATLDRRLAALRERPLSREDAAATVEARATAEAARNAVDVKALDHSRLRAFGEALDALETKIETFEKLAALDRRQADLGIWADQRKKTEAKAAVQSAAARTKVVADDSTLRAYERALDQLRDTLAQTSAQSGSGAASSSSSQQASGQQCDPNSPLCDLNGRSL